MIYIENEYEGNISIDYEDIAQKVYKEAIQYVGCKDDCEVNLLITDNATIHTINQDTRNIDSPTDVLSFPFLEYDEPGELDAIYENKLNYNQETDELILGDIVISYDKVIEQSNEYGHSLEREFGFLIAHSMLHLFGYDHIDEDERHVMEQKQEDILNNLNIRRK